MEESPQVGRQGVLTPDRPPCRERPQQIHEILAVARIHVGSGLLDEAADIVEQYPDSGILFRHASQSAQPEHLCTHPAQPFGDQSVAKLQLELSACVVHELTPEKTG
jgi:hypothetical protein